MKFKSSCCVLLFFFALLFGGTAFLFSCTQVKNDKDKNEIKDTTSDVRVQNSKIKLETYYSKQYKGWGYDIYQNGRLFIHQPYVPAISGLIGFPLEEDAEKAGNFIIYKIRHNITPPSISIEELDSLNVLTMDKK